MSSVRVDVWSDVVCPWCYIGKRRFETAVARLADAGAMEPIEVRYRAYQLDPRAPTGRGVPVAGVYAAKFGGPERATEIFAHLTRVAAEEGVAFDFPAALRANTGDAHRLLALAWEDGGASLQSRLKESLLAAYFTEGLDIGDHAVLTARAAASGLNEERARTWLRDGLGHDQVQADLAEAREREIHSVPTFVIDGGFPIPGAQDPDLFVRALGRIARRR